MSEISCLISVGVMFIGILAFVAFRPKHKQPMTVIKQERATRRAEPGEMFEDPGTHTIGWVDPVSGCGVTFRAEKTQPTHDWRFDRYPGRALRAGYDTSDNRKPALPDPKYRRL